MSDHAAAPRDLGRLAHFENLFALDGSLSDAHLEELHELVGRLPRDSIPLSLAWLLTLRAFGAI